MKDNLDLVDYDTQHAPYLRWFVVGLIVLIALIGFCATDQGQAALNWIDSVGVR